LNLIISPLSGDLGGARDKKFDRYLFNIPESPMKKILLKSMTLSFALASISFAQTTPLDTIIQKLSANYDKITSYSADAVIYKYYCT
jgi:hypothetical protein